MRATPAQIRLTTVTAVLLGGLVSLGAGEQDGDAVSFGRSVRPILVRSCLPCHGFDPSMREADLRLDTFAGATAARDGGRHAIAPGDPDASLLLARVADPDPETRMPPKGEPLTPAEIETVRRWIEQGAKYDAHWSLLPVVPHAPPPVVDPAWSANTIDPFVRRRLEDAGLEPGPEADRRTLIRRLAFDLTGLPPTPERVTAFTSDPDPQAYARLVDEYLASPRFGERWARHWLDLMRYAETYAHEFDYPIRNAWQYRDYVIRALNADVPYDTFVTEHLAGDLLDDPRRHPDEGFNESIIGTGFWWLSQGTHAPVDVRQDEAERIDNQIDVLTKTFLATTLSCARCHDHKFDPITTSEYYGFAGFIQSSRRQQAYLDPGQRIDRAVGRAEADTQSITERLDATDSAAAARAVVTTMLPAALDALFGISAAGEEPPAARDVVLLEQWATDGDAFSPAPPPADAGDEATARQVVTSEPFIIEHDYLFLRAGGGDGSQHAGARLIVEDAPARETDGGRGPDPRRVRWDLKDLRGRSARLELLDSSEREPGAIRVAGVVLSDEPFPERPQRRAVDAVATAHDVDASVLAGWVDGLHHVDPEDTGHPMHVVIALAGAAAPEQAEVHEQLTTAADAGRERVARFHRNTTALESFDDDDALADWYRTGWAFTSRPVRAGAWRAPGERLERTGARGADSGSTAGRLVGTLRSPTFEITHPYLHVRVRGRGVVRVIVDGYTMDEYNALLFERVKHGFDTDTWSWRVHDLRLYVGHRAHYEIIDDDPAGGLLIDEIRFADTPDPLDERLAFASDFLAALDEPTPAALTALVADGVGRALGEDFMPLDTAMTNWLLASGLLDIVAEPLEAERAAFAQAIESIPAPMRVLAMTDGTGEDEYVFIRGDHRQVGPRAPRAFLAVLCDDPHLPEGDGSGRLLLAERLLDESNPMVARVIVNRTWHYLMGRGIVDTTDDFGLLGGSPSHPELLDTLAARFRHELNWSMKALVREIVLSRTYRTAGGPLSPRGLEVDPTNRLWSTRTPKRLDGESMRDAMLAVSGRLDLTMGGPGIPVHLSPFMQGRGRPRESGPVDGDGRRSIYLEVRRNFLSPMMQTFDAPVPHSAMGRRSQSNVPAQSLILLNDPFVREQARLLSIRLDEETSTPEEKIARLYSLTLARSPDFQETAALSAFVVEQIVAYAAAPEEENAAASAWADVCHVVLNLKEFTFIE